jgi:hypothetical protein
LAAAAERERPVSGHAGGCRALAGYRVGFFPVESWEGRGDADLYQEMERRAGPYDGELIFVSEASFAPGRGAFQVVADAVPEFLEWHRDHLEPVFNGDVIVVVRERHRIACFHHYGGILVMEAPAA